MLQQSSSSIMLDTDVFDLSFKKTYTVAELYQTPLYGEKNIEIL